MVFNTRILMFVFFDFSLLQLPQKTAAVALPAAVVVTMEPLVVVVAAVVEAAVVAVWLP